MGVPAFAFGSLVVDGRLVGSVAVGGVDRDGGVGPPSFGEVVAARAVVGC